VSTSGTMTTSGLTLSLDFYRNTYALTINRNSTYISSVSGAGTYRWGQSVSISASPATNSKFTTWSQTSGTTSSFASSTTASTTFTMPKSAATIYANGESTKTYIQDYALATCKTEASNNNKTVYDKRDENSYTVRYINGRCWMITNLKFTGTNLDSSTTNIGSSKTISYGSLSSGANWSSARISNNNSNVFYNYSAATAETVTGQYTTTTAVYDLCPKNWHLPSTTDAQAVVGYLSVFNASYTGAWYTPASGWGYYTSPSTAGWWGQNRGDYSDTRYGVIYSDGALSVGNIWKADGQAIRCVRTS
ncbi:hypothetical protein IJ135_02270, partial [Candidatus Saccharibacteria bacterium]|nr:hypothetical protein [Candidatus Saccharibacteria bacterium]